MNTDDDGTKIITKACVSQLLTGGSMVVNTTLCDSQHHTTTTTILRTFFRDHPGELVSEENFWILWCKGRLTQADRLTIWLGATPSGLTSTHLHHLPFFYKLDARAAAQPTLSKH